jgi:hypothetical protein
VTWNKLGLIVSLPESEQRASTHMQGPVAIAMEDRIRVFFAARNREGKSYPARFDVALDDPTRLLDLHAQPIMDAAPRGVFDDEGAMPACAVQCGEELWMYYSGWNRRVTVPYHNTTGLAISRDGGLSFQRAFDGPLLDRTPQEPWMAVTPWVMREGSLWRMWYVSGLGWLPSGDRLEPIYTLRQAESSDGTHWRRDGRDIIPRRHEAEAIARPCVVYHEGRYHMWYSYRDSADFRDGAGSYRIGYAHSADGSAWHRADDLAGIETSEQGWDSSMLCYPYVLRVGHRLLMFYNGNSFGQSGVGCAVWTGPLPSLLS